MVRDWGLGKRGRIYHGGLQEKNEEVKEKKVKLLQSYFFPSSFFSLLLYYLRELSLMNGSSIFSEINREYFEGFL